MNHETRTPPDFDASGPLAWMAKNGVAANVLMWVLIIGGIVTLMSGIKQEVFPEVDLDIVRIGVVYPGASPAEVEQGVILAIEEAVRGIEGVKEVRAVAMEGMAHVFVDLLLGTDKDRALSDMESAVNRITSFPADSERPTLRFVSNRQQVVSIVYYGDIEEGMLKEVAEDARRKLLEDRRITDVELSGTRPLEVSIEVPQDNLRKHRLTLDQIAQRIRAASVEVPGGGVKTEAGEVLLRTNERRDSGTEFGNIVLISRPDGSEVRVRDVATVKDGFADVDRYATFNDKRAVMINVFRVGDETPLTVADAVHTFVEEARASLPEGLEIAIWADMSEMYKQRLDLLIRNARIGLILVLLTLGMFLAGRLSFWVTLGIPISFAGSLLFFPSADISMNMITLFAFIVTLGMVVDDAIVVGEAIHHHRENGMGRLQASILGVREVARPVTFSILTTCIAFAPMLFVPGVMGKFFRVVPIVVISVLLLSLVESLLILPSHLSHPMPWWVRVIISPYLWVMQKLERFQIPSKLEHFIYKIYSPILHKALRARYLTVAIAVSLVVLTMGVVVGRMSLTFLPKIEGDVISVQLRMPVGTPAAVTEGISERINSVAKSIIDEANETAPRDISRGRYEAFGVATSLEANVEAALDSGGHMTTVMQYLVDAGERPITTRRFVERWREGIGEIPGVDSLTFHYEVGVQPGEPVNIELVHQDIDTLEATAKRLASDIASYSGLKDIDSGVSIGKEQLDFKLRPEAKALGLTESDLARQVRAAFYGSEAARQQRGRDEVRAYVRLPQSERRSLYNVEELVVQTPSGGEMPLAQAATVSRGRAYTAIDRKDGRQVISVTADIASQKDNANEIVTQIRERELPRLIADTPGLSYSLGGEQERQAETMKALGYGFLLAMIVMFSMLAVAFGSYSQPLLVMTAIPFGMIGAVIGHILMGFEISVMSMMGFVALSGVVVNDSLILIVAINDFREQGLSMREAIVAGGTRRFRPILLTSLTTFFGLAPMILETSVQARFLVPMAISLGFGVLGATGILLLLVPCSYLILEDVRRWTSNFFARMRGRPTIPPPAELDDPKEFEIPSHAPLPEDAFAEE